MYYEFNITVSLQHSILIYKTNNILRIIPSNFIYTFFSLPKGPLEYLENFKNPCWLDRGKRKSTVKCLPYFYVVGAPKCGTTDLHRRLIQHPDICQYSQKVPAGNRYIWRVPATNYIQRLFVLDVHCIYDKKNT